MISVIIPMYNAEDTIVRCLESIVAQTISDNMYEVILVDDGSKDNTAELCMDYVQKYINIFYYYQKNQGAAAARNHGLLKAKGEWIVFVDADDVTEEDFFLLATEKVKTKSDMYIFNSIEYGNKVENFQNTVITTADTKAKLIESLCGIRLVSGNVMPNCASLHAKIYGRNLLNHKLVFDNRITFAEDMLFNIRAILQAEKIECINEVVYHYIENPMSVTHGFRAADLGHDDYFLMEWRGIVQRYPSLRRAYEYSILNDILVWIGRDFGNAENPKPMKERVADIKMRLENVRPFSEEKLSILFKRRKKLFVFRKRVILNLVIHSRYYLVLIIYNMKYRRRRGNGKY